MPNQTMIQRHTKVGIFMHWFNAGAWLILLLTGLGLIANPELQPLGQGFVKFMRVVFGGGAGLLYVHITVAIIWLAVWAFFIFRYWSTHTYPFLEQVFTLKMPRDMEWMAKKNLQMTMGYKALAFFTRPLRWLGVDARIPDQEYYNAGQKLAAQAMIVGGLVLAASGLLILRSKYWAPIDPQELGWIQWALVVHYIAAGVTFGILIVHVYMAAISKEERPAFFSMFTGTVPASYAEHHHKLWYNEVSGKASETENQ